MTQEERWVLEEKYRGDAAAPGFARDCARLASGEPVAYVIGHAPFLGLTIHLDSSPLIPRPETEWWVARFLSTEKSPARANFLDLCAGSGAIGCAALKALPEAEVWFAEIDPAHAPTIQKNIRENSLDQARAHLAIGDLFAALPEGLRFDLIAANPPYIPAGRALPASVAQYESARALYAGADGLALIRRIAGELPTWLMPGGRAWVECDAAHAAAARELFAAQGFVADVIQDQYGQPRVVAVSWPHAR